MLIVSKENQMFQVKLTVVKRGFRLGASIAPAKEGFRFFGGLT